MLRFFRYSENWAFNAGTELCGTSSTGCRRGMAQTGKTNVAPVPKPAKEQFLAELRKRFPSVRRVGASQSLFEVPESSARIYVRYSKVHPRNKTFFGLRRTDLGWLEGQRSLICFLWDGQEAPLLVPYSAFE